MASIIKRRNRYSVVYTYTDENGKKRQKWETFLTNADAKKRKAQIEFEQLQGSFIVPNSKTLRDLLEDYMSIYGVNTWSMSTYETARGLIFNYIDPIIGDLSLDEITPHVIEKYYQGLLKTKSKIVRNRKPKNQYLTAHTVREIHKILRGAFNQAVKWELVARNPVINASTPKEERTERQIWDVDTFHKALELCDDDILSLALNLAFSCTLRIGEMLGITLDCIDVSEKSLLEGRASIFINKELQRVNRDVLAKLDNRDVICTFPCVFTSGTTVLVLKAPKTKTSKRRVYLPKTVATMVQKRINEIEEFKELLGDEYHDYNLLFANPSGRPMEGSTINEKLNKLIKSNNLPPIVFHSIRHSSITYKLKWTEGDIKAVQGDSGHARADMVADVYSHILDEDRAKNAQLFDEKFYGNYSTDSHEKETSAVTQTPGEASIEDILMGILTNAEMSKAFQEFFRQQQGASGKL